MGSKQIILASADRSLLHVLAVRSKGMGLKVRAFANLEEAIVAMREGVHDLTCLDYDLLAQCRLESLEVLATDTCLHRVPVILLNADSQQAEVVRGSGLTIRSVPRSGDGWKDYERLVYELLPSWDAVEPSASLSGETVHPSPSAPSGPRVLCIDDDPDVSQVIQLRLEPYGVEVIRAFSGMRGFWESVACRPDLIIMDLVMPDGEGNYVFGRLNSHPLTKGVPVIVLTGQRNHALQRQMLSLGVDAYLTKPLVFEELLQELRRHLDLPHAPDNRTRPTACGVP